MDYDACLAHANPHISGGLVGVIYNDRKKRFSDGSVVYTSTVVNRQTVDGVEYVQTRNTVYKLV